MAVVTLGLATAATLAGCGGGSPADYGPDGYVCNDGHVLRVTLEPGPGRAVLTTSDDALTLLRIPAERGERYAAWAGFELWLDGETALFTFPGGRQTVCTYRAPFTPPRDLALGPAAVG